MEKVNALDIAEKDISRISDGQRQRVMLARAICQDPEIIVLDEPTSSLTTEETAILFRIIADLKKKNISMIKSHSNKNYMTINSISMQQAQIKPTKNIKNVTYFKKNQKINGRGRRHNKLFKSKGFDEFRKRKIKNFKEKPQMYKSLSNGINIKEKKEKLKEELYLFLNMPNECMN